mgnify:CR=1 FL=1
MIESAKSTSALKLFAIVGGLAVVLVGTSGCIRIVSHDTGEVTKTVTDSAQSTKESEGKMEYSITGVEVHDSLLGNGDKVAVIRWHAINNDSDDAFASPYFKVYQNKQVLSPGVADDYDGSSNIQELAPGGEFDGTATYEINDMSPVVIKLEDLAGSSNEFELTFNLE